MAGETSLNQFGEWYGLADAPRLATRQLGSGAVDITRVRYGGCDHEFAGYPQFENAVLVHVQLRPMVADLSLDGARSRPLVTPAGGVNILDLRRDLGGRMTSPFDEVIFHMPLSLYEDLAAPRTGSPPTHAAPTHAVPTHAVPRAHAPLDDPAIRELALSLLPALDGRRAPTTLFLDQLGWALASHVARTYGGGLRRAPGAAKLAGWQERRAKALMEENLAGDVRLGDLAAACGLSVGHFARAFRRTVQMPPHRWLMGRRIDKAKDLLLTPAASLAEVAQVCGFTDQSHFTRVFRKMVGATPGRWRQDRLS
ncbi:helix-turn-helix transcriptional regulator [Phenylobacterium deserti]|nr:AraC family transcriptional regulator [Phenylobacterium deserti]